MVGPLIEDVLEDYYESGQPCIRAGYLRVILMAFVCFWNYGFPEPTGIVSAVSGFAFIQPPPAYS